jgi:methyl coenzyme M reductase subunit C-like uncharacterized protein (methanogenesis marker protein 7)
MATKKVTPTTSLDFDLEDFKRQAEAVKKYAAAEVANKVAEIKDLLREIATLVQLGGVQIKLGGGYGEFDDLIAEVDKNHPDWASSSYDC